MRMTPPLVLALTLFAAAIGPRAEAQTMNPDGAAPRKKLIQIGWDQPPTYYVREHWREIEAATPFDGITLVARFTHDGKTHDENGVLVSAKWFKSRK